MIATLAKLRKETVVAFVGGSDLVKIEEQLAVDGIDGTSNLGLSSFISRRPSPQGFPPSPSLSRQVCTTQLALERSLPDLGTQRLQKARGVLVSESELASRCLTGQL